MRVPTAKQPCLSYLNRLMTPCWNMTSKLWEAIEDSATDRNWLRVSGGQLEMHLYQGTMHDKCLYKSILEDPPIHSTEKPKPYAWHKTICVQPQEEYKQLNNNTFFLLFRTLLLAQPQQEGDMKAAEEEWQNSPCYFSFCSLDLPFKREDIAFHERCRYKAQECRE